MLRTLLAVHDAIPHQPNAFELFGFDVLIDAQLRPWLIEVNASPSLARENPLDIEVKERLVADTLRVGQGVGGLEHNEAGFACSALQLA